MESNVFVWSGTLWLLEQMTNGNRSVPTEGEEEESDASWAGVGLRAELTSAPPPSAAAMAQWEEGQPQASRPLLVTGPKDSFVVRNRPATLTCRALYASRVRFKCAGEWVGTEDHVLKEGLDPVSRIPYMEASVPVHRKQVEGYFGLDGFSCQCFASASKDGEEQVKSDKASVRVAFLRKHFYSSPAGERQPVGATIRLACLPPEGDPKPRVFWLRNGQEIRRGQDSNLILANDGSLIVSSARLRDSGNYTCGARNLATKRLTPTAPIHIFQEGGWSSWSSWSGDCTSLSCSALSALSQRRLPKQSRRRICDSPPPANGGGACAGPEKEARDCHRPDCPVDGDWTLWSHWGRCETDCEQTRTRLCADPKPANGGRTCRGPERQSQGCDGGRCGLTGPEVPELPRPGAGSGAGWETNVAMYAGLSVAGLLFAVLLGLLLWLCCRRRGGRHKDGSYYAASPSANLRTVLAVQPDLTAQAILTQEDFVKAPRSGRASSQGPLPPPNLPEFSSFSLKSGSGAGSTSGYGQARVIARDNLRNMRLNSGSKAQLLEASSSGGSSASQPASIEGRRRDLRRPPRSHSRESGNSDDNYATLYDFDSAPGPTHHSALDQGALPAHIEVESLAVALVSSAGARLTLPSAGITLTVPEGALERGQEEEVYLALCRDPRDRPSLGERETLLSPVVWAGPAGVAWRKPLVLAFPHAASLRPANHWAVSLVANDGLPGDPASFWSKVITLGEENINTPVYAQLDEDRLHVMTESLCRLALVGRPRPGQPSPTKRMKLAAFAPLYPSSLDYSLRLYVVEDLPSAVVGVEDEEEAEGGARVAEDRDLLCTEAGDLAFCLEDLGPGWQTKPAANYQEIPARHVWSGSGSALLHCSFSLELSPGGGSPSRPLTARIVVYQKGSPAGARQVVNVNTSLALDGGLRSGGSRSGDSGVQTIVSSSGRSSEASGPYAVSTALQSSPPRRSGPSPALSLPLSLKRELAERLDPPLESGADWRLLARKLAVSGYLQFFGFRASPTEHILDLWEAREGGPQALPRLLGVLRAMGRSDAVHIMEAHINRVPCAL